MNLKSRGEKIFDVCNIIFMCILMIFFIYPFIDRLWFSFMNKENASQMGLRLFPKFPLVFDAYKEVFESKTFFIALANSVYRTVLGTVLTVFVTFFAGYALSKKTLPFRKVITVMILFTMFFSGGTVPTYITIKDLGLLNTRWALILPLATSAWYVVIARNFLSTIPASLEESAMVDGAGVFRTLFQIVFPISKPIIAVISLWSAIRHWNAWFDAMIYTTKNELMVLQQLLRRILIENEASAMGDALMRPSSATTPETVKAATIVVTVLPIVCVYPFFQKYFVKGINVGAVKG